MESLSKGVSLIVMTHAGTVKQLCCAHSPSALRLFAPTPAFTTLGIVKRNNAAAGWAGVFLFLRLPKRRQPRFLHHQTVGNQARSVPRLVASLKVLNPFAGVLSTFITGMDAFFLNTGFDCAFAAVFRLPQITFQTAITRFFMKTVPIAHQTIHPAWRK